MKQRFPDLVIENCSSGGQRMEPSMIMRTAMTSFSDAHETTAIPIIAANLQRVILPMSCQVWCVLRRDDNEKRLIYSLAAAFLGRMCLSGDLLDLNDEQARIVKRAVDFYGDASDIIRRGTSLRYGPRVSSYNYPRGWQAVCLNSNNTGIKCHGGGWRQRVYQYEERKAETAAVPLVMSRLATHQSCAGKPEERKRQILYPDFRRRES